MTNDVDASSFLLQVSFKGVSFDGKGYLPFPNKLSRIRQVGDGLCWLVVGKLIDISREIYAGAVVYPGDDPLVMEPVAQIGPECPYNLSRLGWTTHFLTHIDAPRHFVADGMSIDAIPLDRFMGEAIVVEVEGPSIEVHHLPEGGWNGVAVLFKTENTPRWDPLHFLEDHVYLSREAARRLVEMQVSLVGIDYIDIERYGDEAFPVHRTLLEAGIPILEGLRLDEVVPGRYGLIALPLKIAGGDGSPVRAALFPWAGP